MATIPAPLSFSSVRFLLEDKSQIILPESAVTFGALLYSSNGPVNDVYALADEDSLAFLYGTPNTANFNEWFQIARAFKYRTDAIGGTANILRVIGEDSLNGALAVTDTGIVNEDDLTTMLINNDDEALDPTVVFDTNTVANGGDDTETKIKFFSKYPTEAKYKIALATADDFATADIDTGVSFANTFNNVPTGTEVAIAIIDEDDEVQEKYIVDMVNGNVDGFGDSNYIETVINNKSSYILAYVNGDNEETVSSFEVTALSKGLVNAPTSGDYIEALGYFEDIESVDINYLIGNHNCISEMITLCETRLNTQMIWTSKSSEIVGVAPATIVQDLIEYTSTTMNRNTTYAEYFGNVALVNDTYNDKLRWVELAGDMIGLRILKNLNGNPWEASAGLLNGQLKDVVKLGWNPSAAYMNMMGKNKINPIISKKGQGIVSWGIRNYTSVESSLTDSTTRGLAIFIWRASKPALETQLFQINDDITRNNIKSRIDQFMETVQSNRGVYEFLTICDSFNNTPQIIDQGQLLVELRIKPSRIAKEILFSLQLFSSGASLVDVA